jgi:hypothetical protein
MHLREVPGGEGGVGVRAFIHVTYLHTVDPLPPPESELTCWPSRVIEP